MDESFTEKKAMQDLRLFSEAPWLTEQHFQKLYYLYKGSEEMRKISHQNQQKEKRPQTQQQRKRFNFFSTQVNERLNTFKTPKARTQQTANYVLSTEEKKQSVPLSKNIRTRSQLRDKVPIKSHNYTRLRKDYEKGFFIGNTSITSKKLSQISRYSSGGKSARKGRLWVGRPVLLFQTEAK